MTVAVSQQNTKLIIFSALLIPIFWGLGGFNVWTSIGLSFLIYLFIDLIWKIGYFLPIPELLIFIAALQWILGPWIDYITPEDHSFYHMYIPENQYMAFVVPGVFLMHLGTKLYSYDCDLYDLNEKAKNLLFAYPYLPHWLIVLGLILPVFNAFLPASLGFVFYILSGIKYIGLIYLIYSDKNNKWLIFGFIIILTFLLSISTGMFHDLLLWLAFTFFFVAKVLKLSNLKKLFGIIVGLFFIITIQGIKNPLRSVVWYGQASSDSGIQLFGNLASDLWTNDALSNPETINDLNIRLNQGWIISKVMYNVPNRVPYANGSTVIDAIYAALVPRIFNPDKAIAGGKKNFELYAQHSLVNTSMGISLAGEGFANFGYLGGILFLFLWGLFVGWFWYKINNYSSSSYSTLMIWSPLLFQQVIKAETELLDVLNHLIKSFILLALLLYFLKIFFKIRL